MTFNQIFKIVGYSLFFLILFFVGFKVLETGKKAVQDLNASRNEQIKNF